MARVLLLALVSLVACNGVGGDSGKVGAAGEEELGPNPIVPPDYELLWDLDAESCDDEGAIVYFHFEGEIDADGVLTGEETWYWFHSGEGWEGDCTNVFQYDGTEGGLDWEEHPCVGCDREFMGTLEMRNDNDTYSCSGYGYETLFDDDERDRIDEESYTVNIMLDPLSPSGNVNQHMLVFGYTMDDESELMWIPRPDARGSYTPLGEDYTEGPATLEWTVTAGLCVSFG